MNWLRWLPFVKAAEWRGFEQGRRFAEEIYKGDAQDFYNELKRTREALQCLYDETADYIRINNLGDVHHNRSMQMARDALKQGHTEGDK